MSMKVYKLINCWFERKIYNIKGLIGKKTCYKCKKNPINPLSLLQQLFILKYGNKTHILFREVRSSDCNDRDTIVTCLKLHLIFLKLRRELEKLLKDPRVKFICCKCYDELKKESVEIHE